MFAAQRGSVKHSVAFLGSCCLFAIGFHDLPLHDAFAASRGQGSVRIYSKYHLEKCRGAGVMFLGNCYVTAYFGKMSGFCLEVLQNLVCAIRPFILVFFCDFGMVPQEIFNTCAVLSAPKQSLGKAISCLCTRFSHTWAPQAPNQSTKTRVL